MRQLLLFLALASVALAHDPGLSTLELRLDRDDLVVREIFIGAELEDEARPRDWRKIADTALEVQLDGKLAVPVGIQVHAREEGEVWIESIFNRAGVRNVTLRSPLVPRLGRGHRQFVTLRDEKDVLLEKKLLSATDYDFAATLPGEIAPTPPAPPPPPPPPPPALADFMRLGARSFLTGYAHLLLLIGLLIVATDLPSAVKIITSLLVALVLATFRFVSVPPRVVEALVAATIVYVSLENVWHRDSRYRWLLAFVFGLAHGLCLDGVPEGQGAAPLMAFDFGLAVGAIGVAAIVLPVVWRLSRLPGYATRYVTVLSILVAGLGIFWFIQQIATR